MVLISFRFEISKSEWENEFIRRVMFCEIDVEGWESWLTVFLLFCGFGWFFFLRFCGFLHGSPALYNLSLANGDRIFGQMKNCGKPWKEEWGVGDWLVFSIRVSLQSSALIWLATLLVIRLQTELDDTKSCYQLIKTMTKFGKEIRYRLYVFTKNNDYNNNSLLGEMRDNSVRTWYVLSTYTGMTCWLSL